MKIIYKDGNKQHKTKNNTQTYCYNCFVLYKKTLKVKELMNMTVDADIVI